MHYFQTNSSFHENNTKYKNQLHIPSVRLNAFEEFTTYYAIKIFNNLGPRISGKVCQVVFKEMSSYTPGFFYKTFFIKL